MHKIVQGKPMSYIAGPREFPEISYFKRNDSRFIKKKYFRQWKVWAYFQKRLTVGWTKIEPFPNIRGVWVKMTPIFVIIGTRIFVI